MTNRRRRTLVALSAFTFVGERMARAGIISGRLPWSPNAAEPPRPVTPGPWQYLTDSEAAALEILADRIIPPDAQTPGGKDAGCVVFIDRQLAGPYGQNEGLYSRPPFLKGAKNQGSQSPKNPAQLYRNSLAALERYARSLPGGKAWVELTQEQHDQVITGLEEGTVDLKGSDAKTFFEVLLKNMKEGFFADPLYGGNRDMCGWKMIGYPGAHYDYRDWVTRHNEPYPHPPVSIMGRPDWTPRT